jgi:uncharacterized protein (TIGR03067 family)
MRLLRIPTLSALLCSACAAAFSAGGTYAQEVSAPASSQKESEKKDVPEKVVSEKEAIKQLQGDYRIVSGATSGKQILPDRLAGITVKVTEKTITTYDGDRNAKFSAAYRLDTQKRPWRITMTTTTKADAKEQSNPETSEGLLDIGETQVKLIYALPNGDTPKDFKAGERQQLFVLERLKGTPAQPSGAEGNPSSNQK